MGGALPWVVAFPIMEQVWTTAGPKGIHKAPLRLTQDTYLVSDVGVQYVPVLESVSVVIDGLESPLGLELLGTIDWLRFHGCEPTLEGMKASLHRWPAGKSAAQRKLKYFEDRLILLTLECLGTFCPPGPVAGA